MDNLEILLTEELQQEFLEYLKEDPEFSGLESLNEEVLTEGKLLNKIRWKLALFSLRFLRESSINDFLRAYYSDKDGKETEKSKEWVSKKRKEKLKKIREIANERMSQEAKDKVANSQQAKQLEAKGVTNFIYAGIAGASAGLAYQQNQAAKAASKETHGESRSNTSTTEREYSAATTSTEFTNRETGTATLSGGYINGATKSASGEVNVFYDRQDQPYVMGTVKIASSTGPFANTETYSNQKIYLSDLENKPENISYYIPTKDGGGIQFPQNSDASISGIRRDTDKKIVKVPEKEIGRTETYSRTESTLNFPVISTILTSLASLFFGVMWGSIILAGVNAAKGVRSMHKANVVRRDEIMGELLKNRDVKNLKECLQFLDGDLKSQKSIIELYESGSPVFYDAVENIKEQASLNESLKFMIN